MHTYIYIYVHSQKMTDCGLHIQLMAFIRVILSATLSATPDLDGVAGESGELRNWVLFIS